MRRRPRLLAALLAGLSCAVLAACKQASSAGGLPSGSSRPSISAEPGDLAVFDWAGYGDGSYYPKLEQTNLWQAYQDQTGDTPQFTLFQDDDFGYTKVASSAQGGVPFDIVHPCAYRFQDYVDLGVMQPWDTSMIPNWSDLNPQLEQFGNIDGYYLARSMLLAHRLTHLHLGLSDVHRGRYFVAIATRY